MPTLTMRQMPLRSGFGCGRLDVLPGALLDGDEVGPGAERGASNVSSANSSGALRHPPLPGMSLRSASSKWRRPSTSAPAAKMAATSSVGDPVGISATMTTSTDTTEGRFQAAPLFLAVGLIQ
jgi:hypothetical protein